MKKIIINILSLIFQTIDKLLCKLHIKHPIVVVFMDGGICSQMLMYIQGQYFAEHGLDVRYDIRWFDVCGKDQFGNHPRIFEFTEMWRTLPFKKISGWRLWMYRHLFKVGQLMNEQLPSPKAINQSMYLYGYWDLPSGEYERLFAKCFDLKKAEISPIAQTMAFDDAIGIHVFLFFASLEIKPSRIVNMFAAGMFPVFLIHMNRYLGLYVFHSVHDVIYSNPLSHTLWLQVVVLIVVAILVLIACSIIDMPRARLHKWILCQYENLFAHTHMGGVKPHNDKNKINSNIHLQISNDKCPMTNDQ